MPYQSVWRALLADFAIRYHSRLSEGKGEHDGVLAAVPLADERISH